MAYEIYVDNIDRDEMRSGFLVTTERKKLWNVQLNLIAEFDRICRKHDLKWYAGGGTLLGAARHGGFIPWDDDVDLLMMRPDYEKFKRIAPTELKPEFYLDLWYNYAREGEPNPNGYPTIKIEQLKKVPWLPFMPMLRLRDNRTLFLRYPEYDNLIQGIWIDVFPFDPLPPFDSAEHEKMFERGEELRLATIWSEDQKSDKTFRERALEYEEYLAANWFESERLGFVTLYMLAEDRLLKLRNPFLKKFFETTAYLPFEKLTLPAAGDYEHYLQSKFGVNWRVPKQTHSHAKIYSADVSYKDYFRLRED